MTDDRPVLKVCGLTRVADIRSAEAAGADFCGFITEIERSPRCVTREQATLLARSCRARPVLVVEEMPPEEIATLFSSITPHAIQLHGGDAQYVSEVAEALGDAAFVWRPIGLPESSSDDVRTGASAPRDEERDRAALVAEVLAEIEAAVDAGAAAVLLDTRTAEGTGGSGRTCDWQAAAEIVAASPCPMLLAGGLGPENLGEALEVTGAAGADLSSSLEAAPGVKSSTLLRALARAWLMITD